MTHGPDKNIHGRTAQHASARRERSRIVSQVTDRVAVPSDSLTASHTPASVIPSPSPASARPAPSPVRASPFPAPSTTELRRPRDDPEGSSQMPPPRRRRRGTTSTSTLDAGSDVPPTQGHEDDPVPGPIWYPGGSVDASLLTRDPQRFYNHGRKIKDLAQPNEPWFQEVLEASGMRDLCMLGYDTILNGMLAAFAERWHPKILISAF
ncbi:early nodulin-like protein 18 [Vicia villosa]|uniref:early nodulin-like protein 18 n=1 Tax=Vicia villosa TaxID=3911 RepID=UPI00273CD457|nr:early nodulin-like protein 18 [Vicia villosa]